MANAFASQHRLQTICLVGLTIIASAFAANWLAPVLIPLVLATFYVITVSPFINFQIRQLKFPRVLAVAVMGAIDVAVILAVVTLVAASISEMAASFPTYQKQLGDLAHQITTSLPFESLGLHAEDIAGNFRDSASDIGRTLIANTTGTLFSVIAYGALTATFVLFLQLGRPTIGQPTHGMWADVQHGVRRYVLLKLIISAISGFAHGLVLAMFGIDLAIVFGLLAFVLNFIPSIGPLIAVLLPLPMILLNGSIGWPEMTAVVVLTGAIQVLIGNVVEPKVFGDRLELHPIVVMCSLLVFGMLWGVPGMFLATPIIAVVKIIASYSRQTRPIADALGGNLTALGVYGRDKDESTDGRNRDGSGGQIPDGSSA